MILVFGSINVDLVARVTTIPRPGETVLSPRYLQMFGGKGANQAIAAARVSLPGRVVMAAAIGDDAFGRGSLDNLLANGVSGELVAVCGEPTGCAFITVDASGENAITVGSGANLGVRADLVPDRVLGADTIAVLQMEVPLRESLAVAHRIRAAGGRVVWNVAPTPSDFAAGDMRAIIAATDILVVNEHEVLTAAYSLGFAADNYQVAGALVAEAGCIAVVTAGAAGALAFHPDGRQEFAVAEHIVPVDTTGAGDTFVGILASGLDEELPFSVALQRACRGASRACLAMGAQASMPRRAELER